MKGVDFMVNNEVWKDVVGYEGLYQVSNIGRVRHLPHTIFDTGKGGTKRVRHYKMKMLCLQLNEQGYYTVGLYKGSKGEGRLVSRLVAEAFIPNPNNLPCVNHKDENSKNNCVDNLEWCTRAYNNQYGTIRERHRQMMLGVKRGPHSQKTKDKISKSITEWHKKRKEENNIRQRGINCELEPDFA